MTQASFRPARFPAVCALVFAALLAAGSSATSARPQAGAASAAQTGASVPPGEEIKAMALDELKTLSARELQFASEMPADKYTWTPGHVLNPPPPDPNAEPYGRTVSDLFLHISNLNITHAGQLGAPPVEGFDAKGFETSTTDKAKIIDWLTKSFSYAINWVQNMSASDLAKTYKVGNRQMTGNAALFAWVVDINDYCGQTIAYGRSNGIIGTGPAGFRMRKPGQ